MIALSISTKWYENSTVDPDIALCTHNFMEISLSRKINIASVVMSTAPNKRKHQRNLYTNFAKGKHVLFDISIFRNSFSKYDLLWYMYKKNTDSLFWRECAKRAFNFFSGRSKFMRIIVICEFAMENVFAEYCGHFIVQFYWDILSCIRIKWLSISVCSSTAVRGECWVFGIFRLWLIRISQLHSNPIPCQCTTNVNI